MPRRTSPSRSRSRALTLVELLVVVAVATVVLVLGVPSLYDYILVQRLKGVNAQLVTDLQFGRSEAVSRNRLMRFVFRTTSEMTCYSIYTLRPGGNPNNRCDCTRPPGSACTSNETTEVRSVQVLASQGVRLLTRREVDTALTAGCAAAANEGYDAAFGFDPVTGGLFAIPTDTAATPTGEFVICTTMSADAPSAPRALRTALSAAGRPSVCQTRPALGAASC